MVTSVMARLRWVGLSIILLLSITYGQDKSVSATLKIDAVDPTVPNTTLVCQAHSSVFLRCAENFTAHMDVQPVITDSGISVTCEGPLTVICKPAPVIIVQPPMAITRGVWGSFYNNAYQSTLPVTMSGNVTTGSTVVLFYYHPGEITAPVSIADGGGNTYTLVDSWTDGSHGWAGLYVCYNVTGGWNTVTFTKNTTYFGGAYAIEYQNVPTSFVVDKEFQDYIGFSSQPTTFNGTYTGTLAQADEVILGFFTNTYGDSNWTAGSGFNSLGQIGYYVPGTTGYTIFAEEKILNSNSTIRVEASSVAEPSAQTQILGPFFTITLKGAGAAPTTGNVPYMRTPVGFGIGF